MDVKLCCYRWEGTQKAMNRHLGRDWSAGRCRRDKKVNKVILRTR